MTYIQVNESLPGIRSLLDFRPEVAAPLGQLANTLLREASEGLSLAERELIGARVSYLNDCFYCHHSHEAIACEYLGLSPEAIDPVIKGDADADVHPRFAALLKIAESVQLSGRAVTAAQVQQAKELGATDRDIHDTVLIAGLFCLFNRYVDGLNANTPADLSSYPPRAKQVAAGGYAAAIQHHNPVHQP